MALPRSTFFRPRRPSLLRGVLLSLGAMAVSMLLAGFPYIEDLHGSRWQMLVVPVAVLGFADTFRCLRPKWSLYHAAVLILLYSEVMILATVVFLCFYL